MDAVQRNYAVIVEAIQEIFDVSHDDSGRKATGLLSQLEKFDTFFGLKFAFLVFSGTEHTSINLQRKGTSVPEALFCAELAISYLRRLRSDRSFEHFYS